MRFENSDEKNRNSDEICRNFKKMKIPADFSFALL